MCLHKKQEILGSTVYCELIDELGFDACPKERRSACLEKINSSFKSITPQNKAWLAEIEKALGN